jgi:hypothetical protein
VLDLCSRIELDGVDNGWSSTVTVTLRDHTIKTVSIAEPRGHDIHPATNDELRAKWRRVLGDDGSPFMNLLLESDPGTSYRSIIRAGLDTTSLAPFLNEYPVRLIHEVG